MTNRCKNIFTYTYKIKALLMYFSCLTNISLIYLCNSVKKWPPSSDEDYKLSDAKLQPSGDNVLKKWPPAVAAGKTTSSPPLHVRTTNQWKKGQNGGVSKKWPPSCE